MDVNRRVAFIALAASGIGYAIATALRRLNVCPALAVPHVEWGSAR